jgi:hypothetical protein
MAIFTSGPGTDHERTKLVKIDAEHDWRHLRPQQLTA